MQLIEDFHLDYNGREQTAVPTNIDLDELLGRLVAYLPVYCDLQPGDGTRYRLSIHPLGPLATSDDFVAGYRPETVSWLWLVTLFWETPEGGYNSVLVDFRSTIRDEDVEAIHHNPWTRRLLARWLTFLGANVRGFLTATDRVVEALKSAERDRVAAEEADRKLIHGPGGPTPPGFVRAEEADDA